MKSLINLFFPKVCAACKGFLLQDEKVICTQCRHDFPLTDHFVNKYNSAFIKFNGKVEVENAATLLWFHKKGIVQELIHNLKYKGHEEIGTALGYWCVDELKKNNFSQFDCVIPVPLHPKKKKERGYNQVDTFGKAIADGLKIPFVENVLIRTAYSKTQTKKSLINRSEIVKEIFNISNDISQNGNSILLVDDVITTGSTLESCIRALQKIPNIKISILCMAMSEG